MKKILVTPKSFVAKKEIAIKMLEGYPCELIFNESGRTMSAPEMTKACEDVDGVIVGIDPMGADVLKSAKNLKAISKYGSGLDNIDLNVAREQGIMVKRADGGNSQGVAELAICLMFAISRNICPAVLSVKQNGWERKIGSEIRGKKAGIIGLGAIGREVAKMCGGLAMEVYGYDPYFDNEGFLREHKITKVSLDAIYKNCDYIFLHLPATAETKGMINKETLDKMKKSAFIINTSRGELTDEDALYDALVGGKIAGAAQDVFSCEPAGEHKLLALDNFILTPHIGAFTTESTIKTIEISTQNLIDMLFKGVE